MNEISVNTFISGTLNTVDAVIGNFVSSVFTHLIQANSGMITLLFTVYVMFIGFKFLNHAHHFNIHMIIRQMIIMLSVYGLVMNWHLYNLFVYNIFTNEPGHIANILIESTGNLSVAGNIANALDEIYLAILHATEGFYGQASFSVSGIAFLFYGTLVFLIGSSMCVIALLLFIYAKMMMAIALALGPIFILFILWEPTQGLFSAWLRKLITLALIPIVTTGILMLMLSVINVTLTKVNLPTDQLQFSGVAPFLSLSLATALILSQVFQICSALGGGITLASLSKGAAIVNTIINKLGGARSPANPVNQRNSQGNHYERFRK